MEGSPFPPRASAGCRTDTMLSVQSPTFQSGKVSKTDIRARVELVTPGSQRSPVKRAPEQSPTAGPLWPLVRLGGR